MRKVRAKGFTLIELLVVIAIIGILSAVILASLSTARQKGNDAATQSDLSSIQTQAQIYYGNSANSYGAASSNIGTSCTSGVTGTLFADPIISAAITSITNDAQTAPTCAGLSNGTDITAYAIEAPSLGSPTLDFCVDSSGFSGTTTTFDSTNAVCVTGSD